MFSCFLFTEQSITQNEEVVKLDFDLPHEYLCYVKRQFNLYHAWLHIKCIERILRERVHYKKHLGKVTWHVIFYCKGIIRSIGIKTQVHKKCQ